MPISDYSEFSFAIRIGCNLRKKKYELLCVEKFVSEFNFFAKQSFSALDNDNANMCNANTNSKRNSKLCILLLM